jgi:hypothetical protein
VPIEESALGLSIIRKLEDMGVGFTFEPPVPEHEKRSFREGRELFGIWATQRGVPYFQHLRIYEGPDGTETAFWFVKLLSSSNFMSRQRTGLSSGEYHTLVEEVPSYGDVSLDVHIPIFAKNLAGFCEHPFRSSPMIQMSRDIAFGVNGDPENNSGEGRSLPNTIRPFPCFMIAENELVWSSSTAPSESDEPIFFSDRLAETLLFGWSFSEEAVEELETVLTIVNSACDVAVSTVESGFNDFRREDFDADYDSVLANPCCQLDVYERGQSRMGAASWFPVSVVGSVLSDTARAYNKVSQLEEENEDERISLLMQIAHDGIGTLQSAAINTLAYSYVIPDVHSQGDESGVDYMEFLLANAIYAGESYEAYNARNNLALMKMIRGEHDSAKDLLQAVVGSDWTELHAESFAYLAWSSEQRGESEIAREMMEKCHQIGGFRLPAWLADSVAGTNAVQQSSEPSIIPPPYCSNCGSKFNTAEENFCSNCGNQRI